MISDQSSKVLLIFAFSQLMVTMSPWAAFFLGGVLFGSNLGYDFLARFLTKKMNASSDHKKSEK